MFHYAATTAGCMFLFNILDTQNVAYQQNKLYFRVAKIKAEIKKTTSVALDFRLQKNFI